MKITDVLKRHSRYFFFPIVLLIICSSSIAEDKGTPPSYYVYSGNGDGSDNGLAPGTAWQSLSMFAKASLYQNDTVNFIKVSSFNETLFIPDSGHLENEIVLTNYGDEKSSPVAFINSQFYKQEKNFGNCFCFKGSLIFVENLNITAPGNLNMGLEGPGKAVLLGNPEVLNYGEGNQTNDFALIKLSPAIDQGLDLGHKIDFTGVILPQGKLAYLIVFEYVSFSDITEPDSQSDIIKNNSDFKDQ